MQRLELALEGTAASVPAARRFVERALASWDMEDASWAAALVVTELAANAALHAGTDFTVVVAVEGGGVRVEVRDGSARQPRTRTHSVESTTGRGLRLVDELSTEWGVAPHAAGKAVWALLPAATTAAPDDTDTDVDTDVDALLAAFGDLDEPETGRAPVALAA